MPETNIELRLDKDNLMNVEPIDLPAMKTTNHKVFNMNSI